MNEITTYIYISSDILVALYMYVQEYYIAVGQNLHYLLLVIHYYLLV